MIEAERLFWNALQPKAYVPPSVWAETLPYYIPDNGINPEPGPFSFKRTPYLREMVDTVFMPGVQEILFRKPTQVGFTTLNQLMTAYMIDMQPGSLLYVMPDRLAAEEILGEAIIPAIRGTPALAPYLPTTSGGITKTQAKFTSMPLYVAWAGSPMRLAMRAIRFLLLDEIDKFPAFSGNEADPISLATKRVSNWGHRARIISGGTPTVLDANIMTRWENCTNRRYFHLPCPHCGEYQVLQHAGLRWPKYEGLERNEKAASIEAEKSAYYECEHCHGKITDNHKYKMLLAGIWAAEGQIVYKDGSIEGDEGPKLRVGFYLNSLYSPWLSFHKLAAEYVLAVGNLPLMMDYRNSRMAMPFEEQVDAPKLSIFERKQTEAKDQGWQISIVPEWAGMLLTSVDTQKDHFLLSIRAWGHQGRSRLIYHARVETFEELTKIGLDTPFRVENHDGLSMKPRMLVIDSGGTVDESNKATRTQQVYQYSLTDPRIVPIKGASRPQPMPIKTTKITPKEADDADRKIVLRVLDTNWFKDLLSSKINAQDKDGEDMWQLYGDVSREYIMGLPVEHKVFDPKKNDFYWTPYDQASAKRNHPWDLETYQFAAAELAHVAVIPPTEELNKGRQKKRVERSKSTSEPSNRKGNWVTTRKGY